MTGNMFGFAGYVCERKLEGMIVWVFFIKFLYITQQILQIPMYILLGSKDRCFHAVYTNPNNNIYTVNHMWKLKFFRLSKQSGYIKSCYRTRDISEED